MLAAMLRTNAIHAESLCSVIEGDKPSLYGITHVGWQEFELFGDDDQLQDEVDRLKPWLFRKLFRNRRWRDRFSEAYTDLPTFGRNVGS